MFHSVISHNLSFSVPEEGVIIFSKLGSINFFVKVVHMLEIEVVGQRVLSCQ
jgi:hypothetical protein